MIAGTAGLAGPGADIAPAGLAAAGGGLTVLRKQGWLLSVHADCTVECKGPTQKTLHAPKVHLYIRLHLYPLPHSHKCSSFCIALTSIHIHQGDMQSLVSYNDLVAQAHACPHACLDRCLSMPQISKRRWSANLLVERVGARPKPGPTVGRPFTPPVPATTRLLLDASSRLTRTDAGIMDVTVLSSCIRSTST